MAKAAHHRHIRLTVFVAGAAALTFGTVNIVTAATDTTEPVGTEPVGTEPVGTEPTDTTAGSDAGTEPMGSMEMTPGELAVVGSGQATSPEAEAFCSAAVTAESAAYSEDDAAMASAFPAFLEAAPEDIQPAAQTVVETDQDDPAFEAAYAEVIDWMRANCGYNEMNAEGGDYYFTGVPLEMPAGPVILSLANVGAELHVIEFARINDDVTLTAEEILALPEEEALASVELLGGAFAMPGMTGYGVVDLPPGRYIAVCPIPQGLTPEMAAQMPPEGAPSSAAPMDTENMGSMPMDSMPMDSMPMGSMAPGGGGELGPPHFVLGMWQEITVS